MSKLQTSHKDFIQFYFLSQVFRICTKTLKGNSSHVLYTGVLCGTGGDMLNTCMKETC